MVVQGLAHPYQGLTGSCKSETAARTLHDGNSIQQRATRQRLCDSRAHPSCLPSTLYMGPPEPSHMGTGHPALCMAPDLLQGFRTGTACLKVRCQNRAIPGPVGSARRAKMLGGARRTSTPATRQRTPATRQFPAARVAHPASAGRCAQLGRGRRAQSWLITTCTPEAGFTAQHWR